MVHAWLQTFLFMLSGFHNSWNCNYQTTSATRRFNFLNLKWSWRGILICLITDACVCVTSKKTFHHAIMVTKFPQNVWFFFLCELSEYWLRKGTNLRILVCVTMLRLRGWGVTTIIFSLRRNIFSLGPFFTYISTPCQCKGSVIVFFFLLRQSEAKCFIYLKGLNTFFFSRIIF